MHWDAIEYYVLLLSHLEDSSTLCSDCVATLLFVLTSVQYTIDLLYCSMRPLVGLSCATGSSTPVLRTVVLLIRSGVVELTYCTLMPLRPFNTTCIIKLVARHNPSCHRQVPQGLPPTLRPSIQKKGSEQNDSVE